VTNKSRTLPRFGVDRPSPDDPFGPQAQTLIGLPPPLRLPGPVAPLAAVEAYCARHPPTIDEPVIVEIVPYEEDTVVVDIQGT